MSGTETRRQLRRKANRRGFTVLGANGEARPAVVTGGTNRKDRQDYAIVYVADEFAPISFPVKWATVRGIAEGYVDQLKYREHVHLTRLLADRVEMCQCDDPKTSHFVDEDGNTYCDGADKTCDCRVFTPLESDERLSVRIAAAKAAVTASEKTGRPVDPRVQYLATRGHYGPAPR